MTENNGAKRPVDKTKLYETDVKMVIAMNALRDCRINEGLDCQTDCVLGVDIDIPMVVICQLVRVC